MRSPLELLEGRFEHALLTTYSFNLRFFEEWVLRALWAAEVRNVVVFVDPRELGHALADRAPSAAGRAYHVVAATAAKAAFHPKVLLVTGSARRAPMRLVGEPHRRRAAAQRRERHRLRLPARRPRAPDPRRRRAVPAARAPTRPPHTAAAIQQPSPACPTTTAPTAPTSWSTTSTRRSSIPSRAPAPPARSPHTSTPTAVRGRAPARPRRADRRSSTRRTIAASAAFFAGPWTVDARALRRTPARQGVRGRPHRRGDGCSSAAPTCRRPALLQRRIAATSKWRLPSRSASRSSFPRASRSPPREDLPEQAAARLAAAHSHIDDRKADRAGVRRVGGRATDRRLGRSRWHADRALEGRALAPPRNRQRRRGARLRIRTSARRASAQCSPTAASRSLS